MSYSTYWKRKLFILTQRIFFFYGAVFFIFIHCALRATRLLYELTLLLH